ncbi:hypothetical protein BJV77DRAFT_124054 [Russula vinacea]|nr:hypothetical protein BJV77DRAFT_124054 [Russula vinacea]
MRTCTHKPKRSAPCSTTASLTFQETSPMIYPPTPPETSFHHPKRSSVASLAISNGAKPCTVVVTHIPSHADRCQETAYTTKPPTPASAIKFPIFDIRADMTSEIGAFINTRGFLESMAEL